MSLFSPYLNYIDDQASIMEELLITWANINSFSYNAAGLDQMLSALEDALSAFNREIQESDLGNIKPSTFGNRRKNSAGTGASHTKEYSHKASSLLVLPHGYRVSSKSPVPRVCPVAVTISCRSRSY